MKNPANTLLSTLGKCNVEGMKVTDTKRARDQCPELKRLSETVYKQRVAARSARDAYETAKAAYLQMIEDAEAVDGDIKNDVENARVALKKKLQEDRMVFDLEPKKPRSSEKETIQELRAKLAKLEQKKPVKSAAEVMDDSSSSEEDSE